ncbi:MAG: DNA polymerase III subunit gamma/tau, partial [Schleiferiaceae bacterium]
SARKYRPAAFQSVVGQQHVTDTLEHEVVSGRLAQALLFTGPRGVGKTTCARILAKRINEVHTGEGLDYSLNIFELDAASNNTVDDIRQLIDQVRFAPQQGKYKVYIIDEVHMLSQAAFNAFLKTLEEPPAHAVFILATTEKHKVLPTILSRCQIFDFKRIGLGDIANHLAWVAEQEGYRTEPEALHAIAEKADGSLRDSLSIFDRIAAFAQGGTLTYDLVRQNLQLVDRALFVRLWEHIEAGDRSSILTSVQHVLDQGFDLQRFLMGFAGYIREVLLAQHPATVALLDVPESAKQQLALAAQQSSAARTAGALKRLVAADAGYRAASNARWHVEVALLDLVPDASSDEKKKPSRVAAPEAESPAHGPSTPTDSLPSPAAPAPQVPPTPSVEPVATETAAPRTQEAAPEPPAPVTAAETAPVPIPEPSEIVEAYRAPEPTSAPEPQRSEPSPVPQPASTAPRVRRTAFSLKDLDRNSAPAVPEEVPPTAETDEPEVATTERNLRPFTQQALDNAWREAADAFQDLPVVRGILQTVVPVLEKDAVVRVSLENKLQEDYLLAERDRLVPRLRQALHNDSLKIETRVEEGAVNARLVYTPDERYAFLLEKNPHLDDFRREFQLDIE